MSAGWLYGVIALHVTALSFQFTLDYCEVSETVGLQHRCGPEVVYHKLKSVEDVEHSKAIEQAERKLQDVQPLPTADDNIEQGPRHKF